MSLFHEQKSFLETNAWQKPHLNSLRYNTSQPGSVIPIIYGRTRQQVNLIALGDYRGPKGKKGKVGALPLGGTHSSAKGKGGGGGKTGTGGKKSGHYSVDVDFGICQGPVDIGATSKVWASPGIAFFQSVGLNLYTGADGQAVDPVFDGLGDHSHYSGTCHVTGTPMDLGNSPVLPNISFEVTGFKTGTAGTDFPDDAGPGEVIKDFLTNERYGAGWPAANLDPDIASGANNYGDYCRAAELVISPALQSQTDAATWVSELARLTNTAIVWSGYLLKFIPYGDLALDANGTTWTPNLTPLYSFTDDDFLPWSPHIETTDPQLGEDDPVIVTRSNPADATNWMSIEYLDRQNQYDKTIIPQFDQGSIDRYGLRTESAINGSCFCHKVPAENSLRLQLQRALYIRNTYRFQVGWQYALLEQMDIVLLTDAGAGLSEQAVRIKTIEENENGDLIIDAEEITTSTTEVTVPQPGLSVHFDGDASMDTFTNFTGAASTTQWTFSVLLNPQNPDTDTAVGLITALRAAGSPYPYLAISFHADTGEVHVLMYGANRTTEHASYSTGAGIIQVDGRWHNLFLSWGASGLICFYDGAEVSIAPTGAVGPISALPFDATYGWFMSTTGLLIPAGGEYLGYMQDVYLNLDTAIANPDAFWSRGHAIALGDNGELPTGSQPILFLHYPGSGDPNSGSSDFTMNRGSGVGGFLLNAQLLSTRSITSAYDQ